MCGISAFSPQQERSGGCFSIIISPVNMSDAWQECMDYCVEVTIKAGQVSEHILAVMLFLFNVNVKRNTVFELDSWHNVL